MSFFGFGISKGYGGPSGKFMEIPGGGGSNVKPSGMESPVGWGVRLEKKPFMERGMDIFWNHTMRVLQTEMSNFCNLW